MPPPDPGASLARSAERLTFVFTDIEGSTRLLEHLAGRYADVLASHADIVRRSIADCGGREVDTQGDAFFIVFGLAGDALRFAALTQRRLDAAGWPDEATVRLRIGVHAGTASMERTGYVGLDVHLGARVGAAAHGGQVLVSGSTASELEEGIPDGLALRSLGVFRLKDVREPVELLQLEGDGLARDFPPPRTLDAPDEPPTPGEPPYLGLAAYEEADASRFFGREALISELLPRIEEERFLAIIGASGSGKSSLVRAGLIPALRASADRRMPGVALLTPTEQPLDALDHALSALKGTLAVAVVDQLEELFTMCRDQVERTAFVTRLLELFDQGIRLVVVLRADFYDRLAAFDRLRALVSTHQAYLGPLGAEELRRAIEGPAAAGNWRFDPGLVDLLVHDVGREPGALPLLGHALRETWQRRRGTLMTLRGYLDSGGVREAISRTADQTMGALDAREVAQAKDIFLRLTELGEETADTRRRATLDELVTEQQDPTTARRVLDRLVDARLVVTEGADAEVAHEALIREWPTLRAWLDEDRETLRLHRIVTHAAHDWDASGHDPALLLRGGRLASALDWLTADALRASESERAYVMASRSAVEQEVAEREAQQRREVEAARRLAETEATAARRLRRRAWALGGIVLVALGLAAGAVILGSQSADNARLAQARELASASDATLASDPELSLLLAINAVERLPGPETDRRLRRATAASLVRGRFEGHTGEVASVGYGHDGSRVVTASMDGTVRLWDAASGDVVAIFRPDRGTPRSAALSPDGSLVVTVTDQGELCSWDVGSGEARSILAHDGGAWDVAFDPTGARVATSGEDGRIRVWDLGSDAPLLEVGDDPGEAVVSVAFSADGRLLLTGDPGWVARVWDARTGGLLHELVGHSDAVNRAVFSPDGTRIATASMDGTARVWDAATGAELRILRGHTEGIWSLAYGPDGSIATASLDGTGAIWDDRTGERVAVLSGHRGAVVAVALSPDGSRVITGGRDGTVRSWAMRADVPEQTLGGFPGAVVDATYDPSGARVLATGGDWTVRQFDVRSGEETQLLKGHEAPVYTGSYNADGTLLLTWDPTGTGRVWDAATGKELHVLEGISSAAFDPGGHLIATTDADGLALHILDASSGDAVATMNVDGSLTSVAWTPDGARLIAGDAAGSIGIWDVTSARRGVTLSGHTAPVGFLAVSPDGARLASSSEDGSVRLWDLGSSRPLHELRGDFVNPWHVRFNSDGSRIVSGGDDGALHVWDTETGEEVATIHTGRDRVYGAAYSVDGKRLLVAQSGGSAEVYQCDLCGSLAEALELAKSRVTRQMSPEERSRYLHETSPTAGERPAPAASASSPDAVSPPPAVEASMPATAADDLCRGAALPCDVPPGTYAPSRFRPSLSLRLTDSVFVIAHARGSIAFEPPGGQIVVMSGGQTRGYAGPDSLTALGQRPEDLVAYLRSIPLATVTDLPSRMIGGRPAIAVEVATEAEDPVALLFVDPLPLVIGAGEQLRIVLIDVGETWVAVLGSVTDTDTASAFWAAFDAFVGTVEIHDGSHD